MKEISPPDFFRGSGLRVGADGDVPGPDEGLLHEVPPPDLCRDELRSAGSGRFGLSAELRALEEGGRKL